MTDLDIVRKRLPTAVADCKVIAAKTGGKVGWLTLWRIATGRTTNPGFETVQHIKRALGKLS